MNRRKNNIHPLIEELALSYETKLYFNDLKLYEIIADEIVISSNDIVIDEDRVNCWSFSVSSRFVTKSDLYELYRAIMSSRSLSLSNQEIDKNMIFYTWYDPMSGNFYFSLISSDWKGLPKDKQLPFSCKVNRVTSLDHILNEGLNDPYKGVIPLEEIKILDQSYAQDDSSFEESKEEGFTLNVWSTILPLLS